MSSRTPDRTRETVLPSFRESFPESMFGPGPSQHARSGTLPPAMHHGHPPTMSSTVPPGTYPQQSQRYTQPSAHAHAQGRNATPGMPGTSRPMSPSQHHASPPNGRQAQTGGSSNGQFLILESNPSGRLQISATSSSSMQHAEWMHSGTAPPAPEAAEQRKLRCTFPGCTRTFLMRPNLERHLRTAHDPSMAGSEQGSPPGR